MRRRLTQAASDVRHARRSAATDPRRSLWSPPETGKTYYNAGTTRTGTETGGSVDTRTIALVALVIAIVVALFVFVL